MHVRIPATSVSGTARAPPSKSYTHRAILAAGLSGDATVNTPLLSADTRATMRAVRAFGGAVDSADDSLTITGVDGSPTPPADVIDCANSGTTMRLVTGTAALVDGMTVLTGDSSLRDRPQGPLLDAIGALGATAQSTRGNGQAPLVIAGPIEGGSVSIPGDVSSQYISSLLMAGPCTNRGIDIELETSLKSAPYVEITREVLSDFGISTVTTEAGFSVSGDQSYQRADPYTVPGDFSSISYLAAAGAVAGDPSVTVVGAYPSAQGDTAIIDILDAMGAEVHWDRSAGELTVSRSSLAGITVDVGDTPDLLPTVAVLGAIADGTTRIENCEHVRYKETDRVAAMATELSKLGAVVEEEHDVLTIDGGASELSGGVVETYDDHRIVMALTIAGLVASDPVEVPDAGHVTVSFPAFFDVLTDLGVDVHYESTADD